MLPTARRHDRDVLDALEGVAATPFEGDVWRITRAGYDPLRGSVAAGRWSPPNEFEVLYTSLEPEGALAEIGYRLSLEPVWPSLDRREIHRIGVSLGRVLRFPDMAALARFGVDVAHYSSFDYAATQAMAAAANFLGFEALIVPSARSRTANLVVLLGNTVAEGVLTLRETAPVDWTAWRRRQRASPK